MLLSMQSDVVEKENDRVRVRVGSGQYNLML